MHFDELDKEELANVKGNVSAMVQIGSVGGALMAFVLADRIGRLWATRQLCALWIIGIVIFLTNNGRLGQVYAGRFIAGLGIGLYPIYRQTRVETRLTRPRTNHRHRTCLHFRDCPQGSPRSLHLRLCRICLYRDYGMYHETVIAVIKLTHPQ